RRSRIRGRDRQVAPTADFLRDVAAQGHPARARGFDSRPARESRAPKRRGGQRRAEKDRSAGTSLRASQLSRLSRPSRPTRRPPPQPHLTPTPAAPPVQEPPPIGSTAPAKPPATLDDAGWAVAVSAVRSASPRVGTSLGFGRLLSFAAPELTLAFSRQHAFHR